MLTVTAFCVPGRHPGQPVVHDEGVVLALPEGWRLTRASYDRSTGKWCEDPTSPAKVCVCPEHDPARMT